MWTSKPLWLEGMFVRPQHFQQAERHLADVLNARMRSARAFGWGWTSLTLDRAQLRLGKVAIAAGAGVMPDGTVFDFADPTLLPVARAVPSDLANRRVFLTLATPPRGTLEVQADDRPGTRLRMQSLEVPDVMSPNGQTVEIRVGLPAFRLAFEGEDLDGQVALGCVRIDRLRDDQEVVLSDRYIPPVLEANADLRLAEFLREIVSLLNTRGNALAERLNPDNWYGSAGLLDFAMLQTINRYEPVLTQFVGGPGGGFGLHPLELYRALLQLAGELATFKTGEHRPPAFAAYQHDDLEATFMPVMLEIRRALTTVMDQPIIQIPLEARRFGIHIGQPPDRTLLKDAQFVLAVNAAVPPDSIRALFPSQVKIGPVEEIRDLVNLQLPGIGLTPLAVAPRQLPFRRGFTYFELDRGAASWNKLESSAAIALHVSGEFPDLEMDFWAIRAAGAARPA